MTELYINGRRMELDSETVIARTFQQNLITSQGSVDSPYTNSFSLPYTKTNAEVLGSPEEATSLTDTPYLKLDCVIRQDGIEQFPNSIAELQGFEDGRYYLQVFAGAVPFFDLLGDSNIQQLDFSQYRHIWNFANVVAGLQGVEGVYIYDLVDRGKPLDLARVHPSDMMPSVFAKAIWDRIFSERGIPYVMEPNADFDALTVPFSNETSVHTGQILLDSQGEISGQGWLFPRTFFHSVAPFSVFPLTIPVVDYGIVTVKLDAIVTAVPEGKQGTLTAELFRNGVLWETKSMTISSPGVYEFEAEFPMEYGLDLSEWTVGGYAGGFGGILGPEPGFGITQAIRTVSFKEDVYFGTEWDISLNLPDMKQKDFVLAMCKLFGWGLVYDAYSGTMHVKPLVDTEKNIPVAKDWSGKLDYARKPKTVYKLPETARNNLYKWKEDETVQLGHGDGVVVASNEHLEPERTALEMPFAASADREGLVYLPMFTRKVNNSPGNYTTTKETYAELLAINNLPDGSRVYVVDATGDPTVIRGWAVYENKQALWFKKEREDDYDNQKIEPRLAYLGPATKAITVAEGATTQAATVPVATFAPLSFEVLIPKYYAVLQRVLSRVQMHSVPVLLTAQDFAELDSTVPVWVEKFRDYYYVNKVTDYVSETLPCEVELIKLN